MRYYKEFDINTFNFSEDAKELIDTLRDEDPELLDTATKFIESHFKDSIPTESRIDDYVRLNLEDELVRYFERLMYPEAFF